MEAVSPGTVACPRRSHLTRTLLLTVLFAAEIVAVSVGFNDGAISADPRWWAGWVRQVPELAGGVLAAIAAFTVLASPRLGRIRADLAAAQSGYHWGAALVGHVAAWALLYVSTWRLYETPHVAAGWALLWAGAGVATSVLFLRALAPLRFWRELAVREHASALLALALGFVALHAGELAQGLWEPLASATFRLSRTWLTLLYPEVVYESAGKVLGTPDFKIRIAPACSGYEGMGLIVVFLSSYLFLFRRALRFPHALLLVPIGLAGIWLANTVRIAALVAIGTSFSKEIAIGAFHSKAGWLFFLAVSTGLMVLAHRATWFSTERATGGEREDGAGEAVSLLLPALVLLAGSLVLSAFSSEVDWGYPLKVSAAAGLLWCFRARYATLDWRPSWLSIAVGGLVFAMWLALEPRDPGAGAGLGAALAERAGPLVTLWLAFRVAGSAVVVPLAEELAFRGYLMRKLVAVRFETVPYGRFTWLSFLGSSIAFGALHGRWLAGTLAGLAFAWLVVRRGRLAEAIYAHAVANALIAGYVLAFGQWGLWL